MNLRPYQQCLSAEGWQPIKVASASQPDESHLVLVCPWGIPYENICDCPAYFYRGRCRHQTEAMDLVCGWSELLDKVQQDEHQKQHKVCPRCKGPTQWKMEVVDGDTIDPESAS